MFRGVPSKKRSAIRKWMWACLVLGLGVAGYGGYSANDNKQSIANYQRAIDEARGNPGVRANVSSSRSHHPHNQYLDWGPQRVTISENPVNAQLVNAFSQNKKQAESALSNAVGLMIAGGLLALYAAISLLLLRKGKADEPGAAAEQAVDQPEG